VLVATDVAARGIHVDDVDLVVHFDPAKDDKHYLHRSGRTARAGTKGTVLSLVEHSQERGALDTQDADLIEGVFEFSEKTAREVMTPRTEIIAISADATLEETLAIIEDGGFSRYPVYDDSIDNVVGILLAKDLLRVVSRRTRGGDGQAPFGIRQLMRSVHIVPGSREVEEVLADFKRLKEHMAIVLDEYGGTAGVVTMEDLLEEIVGEILDEYDEASAPVTGGGEGEAVIAGSTHIGELNEHYGLTVPDEDYTTIGGYVFGALGRLPVPGDRVQAGGAIFTVRTMDGRRIDSLSVDLHTLGDRRERERRFNEGEKAAPPGELPALASRPESR